MSEIVVVTPPVASTDIDMDLVNLTKFLHRKLHGDESYGYGLGGPFGYGIDFENDTFAMFPFYWGDCTCGWEAIAADLDEPHDADCYQTELAARFLAAGLGYDPETWQSRTPDLPYDERRAREDAIYQELTTKYGLSRSGCAVHCTCTQKARWQARFDTAKFGPEGHAESCPTVRPNFVHKPSGLQVRWYKWIGRDMEFEPVPSPDEWRTLYAECVASVSR